MKYIFIFIIKIYQILISPLFPPSCRFYPTCSNYSIEAIRNCGAIKGVYYSIKRILRCNPFNEGGFDPAPTCNHKHLKQV